MPIINSTYFWLALSVALAVLEACTSTLVCIWFVFGSRCAFVSSLFTDSLIAQFVVFITVSRLCLAATRHLAGKVLGKKPTPTNADMLIGKTCTVTQDIMPGVKGRVSADGLGWMAESECTLKRGERAEIAEIRGATLVVRPRKETVKNT